MSYTNSIKILEQASRDLVLNIVAIKNTEQQVLETLRQIELSLHGNVVLLQDRLKFLHDAGCNLQKAIKESDKEWEKAFLEANHINTVKGYVIISEDAKVLISEIQDDFTTFSDVFDIIRGLDFFSIRYSSTPNGEAGSVTYEVRSHGILKLYKGNK